MFLGFCTILFIVCWYVQLRQYNFSRVSSAMKIVLWRININFLLIFDQESFQLRSTQWKTFCYQWSARTLHHWFPMEVVLWINISLFFFSCISNWKCGFANRHIAIALLDHPWFHPLLARSAVMSLAAAIRCMFICTCTISIKARVWCHSTNHRGIWGNIGRLGKRLYCGNMYYVWP